MVYALFIPVIARRMKKNVYRRRRIEIGLLGHTIRRYAEANINGLMLEVTICDLQWRLRGFIREAKDVMKEKTAIIPFERIATAIHLIRGQKLMLDRDLALLYGVEKIRNISQIVISL